MNYWLTFSKLPAWAELSDEEYSQAVRGLIAEVEEEGDAMRKHEGIVLPPPHRQRRKLCRQAPHARPKKPKRTIVVPFIAATREVRKQMIEAYRQFLEAYRAAADLLRAGNLRAKFPPGCFPPAQPFVPAEPVEGAVRSP